MKHKHKLTNGGRCVSITYPQAKRDYVCYGCQGEYPIPAGEWYMKVTISVGGRLHSHHYCQRCGYALENKLYHTKGSVVTVASTASTSSISTQV